VLAADAVSPPGWARAHGWPQAFQGSLAAWQLSSGRPNTLRPMGIVGCVLRLGNITAISFATGNHTSPVGPKASRVLRRRCLKQLFLSPTRLVLISPTSLVFATTWSSSDSPHSRAAPAVKRAPHVGRKREPRLVPSLNDKPSCRTSMLRWGLMAQRVCLPAGAALGPSRALPQGSRVFSGAD
jgi:hypothetical protein